ncbi:TPA: helix-turn-helix domain-containing protein [Proteus mirabilis]|uniref:helix-turn-helix domain-containing protein n=1 Tax=Proteus mirabilis TaxID=584 RepID=UPI000DE8CA77|nr:helix-turn-helix domain-containing protein [Proteus mirabilis]EKT9690807.1 helix-turn-helix domain-containing protein [Proteus mirabilis]ELT0938737.1 helix-turn-helix domain-containing protein [Proteus mirabilis]MBG2745592.1 helix-turn-helix domain-containing protein [Proteus mirabilis]MBG2833374.1 helix-turn-helix domain-containing protein [Proteus mirabilis]MBG3105186.1 helix-turn-helix domain-containing protein [Proteus mirabilis]
MSKILNKYNKRNTHHTLHEIIVKETIDWIENNLCNPLNITIVSQKVGYTKWHFQRIFKQYTGFTISRYIRMRRLSKSALDLITSDKPVIDIAIKYQFDSLQSYHRAFKRMFKVSPNQYRKNIRKLY